MKTFFALPLASLPAAALFVLPGLLSAAEAVPLLTAPQRRQWIWSGEKPEAPGAPVAFETEFALNEVPVTARIQFTAVQGCKVFVNGSELGANNDPQRPTAVEAAKSLQKGDNKIPVEAKAGGEGDAFVLSMLVADAAGTRRRLDSNASCKVVSGASAARELQPYGSGRWGDVFASLRPSVCPPENVTVPEGFKVEMLHALDDDEGAWVAMCLDPKGRLIASDAGGKMVRITPPSLGAAPSETKIEPIPVELGHANGLLWAFDSLYVTVCQEGVYGTGSGIYRVTDTNGDDVLDKVELLRKLHGSGDHGPHALVLSPDGKSITVVCGNSTRITEIQQHQVPPIWQDDLALPKITGHGFMLGAGAPAGYIARMFPDGKQWTLAAAGFRNQYDAAYNRVGELFTYDADMEWDLGMPWYRPTRVCHVVDGAEFGWRSVSGKWPQDYADSLPPVLNIGRGSPTGVAFGYGAKFPARYQEALYAADWTYGKLYAVHLKEAGATYSGRMEVFVEGRGLKLTDLVVNPRDGAMYFAGGSRRSNSALYRVSYTGKESVAESVPAPDPKAAELRALRHQIEAGYHETDEASLALALKNLTHEDRFIRFAARTLLEFRPVAEWETRALALNDPKAVVQVSLALARLKKADVRDTLFRRLEELVPVKLTPETRLDVVRALQVVSVRLGDPEGALRDSLLQKLHAAMPSTESRWNVEASQLLVRWKSPQAAQEIYPLFEKAPSQEEQMSFAASLRLVSEGWPEGAREKFFRWFLREEFHKAGNLAKFIADIRKDAVASLTDAEKVALEKVLSAPPESRPAPPVASRLFVKDWGTDELISQVEPLLKTKRDIERGKALLRETGCAACHLYRGEGGAVGPDLTLVGNRFTVREIIESMTEPSKVISDQYGTTLVALKNGTSYAGRMVNEGPDLVQIQENIFVPSDVRDFSRKDILKLEQSPLSLMPPGLLNTCHPDEVADLIAWLQKGAL
jgi:putative heme-binding domain-containing protein